VRFGDGEIRSRLPAPSGEWASEEGLRDSAVLAMLVELEEGDHLLFNRRRDDLPFHPGQICFPGGAREGDEDAVACALRETCEEMGVDASLVSVLGRLPDRVSIAGFRVAAFVARLSRGAVLRPHEGEVAEVFHIPCSALLEGPRWSLRDTTHPRARFRRVPYFEWESRVVWGLTGIILRDFTRLVALGEPPF
jgi:8-oxo-dGTP pyrophosphatase MutT (NUDIX family)